MATRPSDIHSPRKVPGPFPDDCRYPRCSGNRAAAVATATTWLDLSPWHVLERAWMHHVRLRGRGTEIDGQWLAAGSVRRKNDAGEARRLSAASVKRPLALLRHLLRFAHEEWEVLQAVPKIRLEREPQGRLRRLEPDEEQRLLEACRGRPFCGWLTS